jgi:hypothetical protein
MAGGAGAAAGAGLNGDIANLQRLARIIDAVMAIVPPDASGQKRPPPSPLRLPADPAEAARFVDHRLDQLERLIARLAPSIKKTFRDSWNSD